MQLRRAGLLPAERQYRINTKSCGWKVRKWLEGAEHPFIVWTDHKNLEYIFTVKCLNSRQARWACCSHGSTSPSHIGRDPRMLSRMHCLAVIAPRLLLLEPETILPNSCLATTLSWGIGKQVREAQHSQPNPGFAVLEWAHSSRLA
jgi:hypothetical protein